MQLIDWLREVCSEHSIQPYALYRRENTHQWPLSANDEPDLTRQLEQGGHFLPLPKEPAALANILEVQIVEFILNRLEGLNCAEGRRGTERGYPDIEVTGPLFGGGYHAVDVKVARRARGGKRTDSRIALYTGNTYFRYPALHWPGTFRPFQNYASHLAIVILYTLNGNLLGRVENPQVLVQESWRIGSKKRASTTREYIGAVQTIKNLEEGAGEFQTPEEFFYYWRKFGFKIGKAVQNQLDKLIAHQS